MSQVTLKGDPVSIGGNFPSPGSTAPDFSLANAKRENINLSHYDGKIKILNIFPSIDTPTCALSVKRFNDEVSSLENTVVLCISADLPFAQKRFCKSKLRGEHFCCKSDHVLKNCDFVARGKY